MMIQAAASCPEKESRMIIIIRQIDVKLNMTCCYYVVFCSITVQMTQAEVLFRREGYMYFCKLCNTEGREGRALGDKRFVKGHMLRRHGWYDHDVVTSNHPAIGKLSKARSIAEICRRMPTKQSPRQVDERFLIVHVNEEEEKLLLEEPVLTSEEPVLERDDEEPVLKKPRVEYINCSHRPSSPGTHSKSRWDVLSPELLAWARVIVHTPPPLVQVTPKPDLLNLTKLLASVVTELRVLQGH